MELFDVVNKYRKPLGYKKQRGAKLEEDEYNVGIEIWIFNNKKLLMTQRSLNKSHPGEWEVPGGCSIAGEISTDTLIREAYEEIGIKLNKNNYQLLDTIIYKKQFVDVYKSNMIVNIDKIILQEEEVSDIKFVSKKEFLEMATNNKIVKSVYNRYEIIKDKIAKDW